MKKEYYIKLDIIRILSCFVVLFYHLNLLKGGYLAVCIFFALTGYLSIVTNYNKKFSLKDYYLKRLKKIYLPLLIVVFLTIGIINILPNINYLNYKREVFSIIFGYNNYWQLHANLDYFVRNANSPFTHLWYIAILIQFELIFPFILLIIKKLDKKINKYISIILITIISIISYILFYITMSKGNIMTAYYGTIERLYSITLGILLGLIHIHSKDKNKSNNFIFYLYIIVLIILFIFIKIELSFSSLIMLLTTIISLRLIDLSIDNSKENNIIKKLSNITYEIYLVQYPVIYIFQNINLSIFIKVPIIIIITILISLFINKLCNINKKENRNILLIIIYIILLLITIFGTYKFIILKDNTKEINKLKSDLKNNQLMMKEKQKEYLEKKKQEEDEWNSILSNLDNDGEALKEKVKNMPIVGIGDSIMELALKDLYEVFPNGYFDAAENRTARQTVDIIKDLNNRGIIGDTVVMCIGTNGEFYDKYTEAIMAELEGKTVFWFNATNADYPTFNGELDELASRHSNIQILDWVSVINEHPEYLISDKVHPTIRGCKVYANFIYEQIYNSYLNKLKQEKEQKILEHEQQENKKITFIGNDLLVGIYNELEKEYNDSEFIIVNNNYKSLIKEFKNIDNHNIVLLLDNESNITKKDYEELANTYKDKQLYIIDLNNNSINKDNITIINYSNYKTSDGVHLNKKSNNELIKLLKEKINNDIINKE